jgi:Flp pilus assembly protein TadD
MASIGAQSPSGDEYFRQGVSLAKAGHWEKALAAYKESIRLDPNNAQTYMNLGFVYYELGYDFEAQQAFERAAKLQARPCVR